MCCALPWVLHLPSHPGFFFDLRFGSSHWCFGFLKAQCLNLLMFLDCNNKINHGHMGTSLRYFFSTSRHCPFYSRKLPFRKNRVSPRLFSTESWEWDGLIACGQAMDCLFLHLGRWKGVPFCVCNICNDQNSCCFLLFVVHGSYLKTISRWSRSWLI